MSDFRTRVRGSPHNIFGRVAPLRNRGEELLQDFATDERAMLMVAPRVALSWLIPQDGNVARVTGLWRVHGESLQIMWPVLRRFSFAFSVRALLTKPNA